MSLLDAFRNFIRPYDMNERALSPTDVWGRGGVWHPLTGAGVNVTVETAMQAAAGACIRLLADDISSLPVDVYRKVEGVTQESNRPQWLEYPTGRRWDTFQAHLSDVVVSMLTDGNAYIECFPDTFAPRFFRVHDPARMVVEESRGTITYRDGVRSWSEAEMAHIPWVRMPGKLKGLSVLDAARDSTGLELAARQWAGAFFRNGGTLGTIIEYPTKPSEDEVNIMRRSFDDRHRGSENAFKLGVLTGGAKLASGTIRPNEAALEPLWKHVLEEAARVFHIPPHLLGSQDPGGSSYASVEQRSIEYVQHAIVPVTTRVEHAYSRFLGRNRYIKLNTNALLRGDIKSRAAWYQMALTNKVIRPSEVRDREDLPFDAENTGYLQTPNNNAPADYGSQTEGDDPQAAGLAPAPERRTVFEFADVKVDDDRLATIAESVRGIVDEGFAKSASEVMREMRELRADNKRLLARVDGMEQREAERSQPVSIRVDGDIVYEERAGNVVRKRVRRDENGKVIALVAEVA